MRRLIFALSTSFLLLFGVFLFIAPEEASAQFDQPKQLGTSTSCTPSGNSIVRFHWDISGYSRPYSDANWDLVIDKNDGNGFGPKIRVSGIGTPLNPVPPYTYNAANDPVGTKYDWRIQTGLKGCTFFCESHKDGLQVARRTCANDPEPDPGPGPGETSGSTTPSKLDKGGQVVVKLFNIPNSENGNIIVGISNTIVSTAVRLLHNNGACSLDQYLGPWVKTSTSCSTNNSITTFTGTINTSTFDITDPTNDTTFNVFFQGNSYASFIINASAPNPAQFNITSITPDPADPGGAIKINLSNITKNGTFTFGVAGEQGFSKNCPNDTCVLELTLQRTYETETVVTINVLDPDGNRKSKTLTVKAGEKDSEKDPEPTNAPLSRPCADAHYSDRGGCLQIRTALGDVPTDPNTIVRWMLGIVLGLAGTILLLILILNGYKLMTSQGNPEVIQDSKNAIVSAIAGLLMIIFSLVLIRLITTSVLGLPGFG